MKKLFSLAFAISLGIAVWFIYQNAYSSKPPLAFSLKSLPPPPTLRVLNWSGYISQDIKQRAERELNITIVEEVVNSNDEFLQKIQTVQESEQYDLVMPTDYMVMWLAKNNYIEKVDYTQFPQYVSVYRFLREEEELYSVFQYAAPFLFGTLAIGYNAWELSDIPLGWGDIFSKIDPNDVERRKLRGRMAISYDMRNSLGIALMYLGYSPNSTVHAEVEAAGKLIMDAMDNNLLKLQVYNQARSIVERELLLTAAWSGETAEVMASDFGRYVRYAIPNEGAMLFVECLAIMKSSQKKALAQQLINYLLKPEISAEITNTRFYGSANEQAVALVGRELVNGAPYYIPPHQDSFYVRRYLPPEDEKIYREVWDKVVAHYKEAGIEDQVAAVQRSYLP